MNLRPCAAAMTLLACACTFTPQTGGSDAEFHPPLVDKYWQVEHFTTQSGARACSISSGYNGLTVLMSRKSKKENLRLSVKSNHHLEPGATLTANVDNATLRTSEDIFPPQVGQELVKHLTKGDKLYLEWSEMTGPFGSSDRIRVQNIVQLNGFAEQLKQCRDSL